MTGQHLDVGGLEHAVGQRQQVRVVLGERGARTCRGGQRTDGQPTVGIGGMTEQQPQDLAARVSAGTGHRH